MVFKKSRALLLAGMALLIPTYGNLALNRMRG
jgi:hypothetical protein